MARLTPVNYNMQVLNPLQTAMAGYQAGFGQFQQLDEVRRQREADRMAAEKHGLQMELLRAQTAQQVRETERANAMQTALGTMWGRMADGENVTSRDVENMMAQFPELKDTLDTTYERLSGQEREAQFNSIFRIGMLGSDPDLFTAEMQRNIDARADNPDEQKVWEGMLQAYNAAEAQEPGGGAAAARLYAGMSLLSLADNEEQRNLVESKFFPQQEKPPEGFRTLQARAEAAGLQEGTPEYQEFMRLGGRPQEQQMGIRAITRADGTTEFSYGPMDQADALGDVPFDVDPDQPRGEQATVVRIPGTAEIRISPEPQQAQATKAFNAYGSIVRKHDMMRSQANSIRELIEMGEGGYRQFMESVPGFSRVSYAQKLRNHIVSLQNQVAFANLAEMRQNSPTGGAVGSLTDAEREALGALLGPLDPYFPDQVLATLDSMDLLLADDERRYLDALETDYGTIATIVRTRRQAATETEAAQSRTYNITTRAFE